MLRPTLRRRRAIQGARNEGLGTVLPCFPLLVLMISSPPMQCFHMGAHPLFVASRSGTMEVP